MTSFVFDTRLNTHKRLSGSRKGTPANRWSMTKAYN